MHWHSSVEFDSKFYPDIRIIDVYRRRPSTYLIWNWLKRWKCSSSPHSWLDWFACKISVPQVWEFMYLYSKLFSSSYPIQSLPQFSMSTCLFCLSFFLRNFWSSIIFVYFSYLIVYARKTKQSPHHNMLTEVVQTFTWDEVMSASLVNYKITMLDTSENTGLEVPCALVDQLKLCHLKILCAR